MIKILLSGSTGTIGKKIIKFFKNSKKFKIKYFYEKENKNIKKHIKKSNIIVDFSHYKKTMSLIKLCIKFKKKIIIGTTGFSKKNLLKLKKSSRKIAIFLESNMNYYFNIFIKIISFSYKYLKKMDNHVIEIHKKKKSDFPSGSCKKILNIINNNNFSSLRMGNIIGDHQIIFCDKNNKITIKHSSLNRKAFLLNIKKIIIFILKKSHGIYNINNI